MRQLIPVLFALALLTSFLSCGETEAQDSQVIANQTETEQTSEEVENEEPVTPEDENTEEIMLEDTPSVFLELCYATSVNMPENQFGPENVFDNDPNTSWVTMPGAGPGEGLFFSFEEPIHLDAINIQTLPGSSTIQEIATFRLYINGLQGYNYRPGDIPIPINTKVKSLFIRINSSQLLSSNEYPPEDGISYTGSLSVGFREITLLVMNEDGNEVPLRIQPIRKFSGRIEASSSLEPIEAYHPDFLFDSRSEFGWADGNEDNTGEGESLSFYFDQIQHIEKIKIWNGYHRSQTHFDQNERAASISFGVEGGEAPVYRLADTRRPLVITLDAPLESQSFALNFLDIYEGTTYKDLVLSELRFFSGEEWFVLDSGESEVRKRDLLEWAQNTSAEAFIDKQIFASNITAQQDYTQTLILRSNGSFILWKQMEDEDGEEITYADGNWQIIDDNSVRIFGRLHRIGRYTQASYNPYSGVQPAQDQEPELDRITIFTDVLQFDESLISSDRGMFDDFVFQ